MHVHVLCKLVGPETHAHGKILGIITCIDFNYLSAMSNFVSRWSKSVLREQCSADCYIEQ